MRMMYNVKRITK